MNNPDSKHNQPVQDPIAHFKAIPWCLELLSDPSIVDIQIANRTTIPSREFSLVRETLNTPETVRACVVFLRRIKSTTGVLEAGETNEKPFLELVGLLDLGQGVNGYAGTAHGGFYPVVLDEIMGSLVSMESDHKAYTAYLNVRFKKPLQTPQVVVVRGRVQKKEGRKLYMKGRFEDKNGEVFSEADGMWIMIEKRPERSGIRVKL